MADYISLGGDFDGFERVPFSPEEPAEKVNGHSKPKAKAPDWPLLTYGDAIEAKGADYLIKGVVNRGEFSAWFGPPKNGKSFIVLDKALHVAAGRRWRGRRVRQGRVLYLALEGGGGINNRLVAAQTKFGRDRLPFHVLTVPIDLLNGDGDRLLTFINAKVEELGGAFDLIVLDTLSRSMPGGNENSPETMTMLVGVLDRLRAATGAHVAVVHHTGKDTDKGMRGHSSLLGAVDLAVEIKDRVIRIADARECPEGDTWGFDLDTVNIGTDDDGDAIFSCVVRELGEGEEPTQRKGGKPERKPRPLGPVEAVVLDAFRAALVDRGKPAEAAGAVARDIERRATVVRQEHVDAAAERYLPGHKGNKRREAVERALITLAAKRIIRHADGWYWLPPQPSHGVA